MSDSLSAITAALEGRYSIEREVGEGGMAKVYLARDLKHDRNVALKVLKPELAAVVGAERFLAEIKTTANLQHPHILPLFDSGEADGFLFYVMPYVEGESLRDRLDQEKQLPVDEAVRIAVDLAEALHHAHSQGVVHRDIKPGNVLLRDGRPLIADFGIALAVGSASEQRLTETGLSLGTPFYMSPEQATGDQAVGPATDTYALACVLYEMLVGDPPFKASTAQAVLGRILTGTPDPITEHRRSVPLNVEGAVLKALEKLPADRFKDAGAFGRALGDTGFRYGVAGAAAGVASSAWAGRWVGIFGAIAVGMAGLAAWAWSSRSPDQDVYRLSLDVASLPGVVGSLQLSPDGSMLGITGSQGATSAIFVRSFEESEFRALEGTTGAGSFSFSPNSDSLVFLQRASGRLMKTSVRGSGVVPIVDSPELTLTDPTWNDDGTILLVSGDALYEVSADGTNGLRLVMDGLPGPRLPTKLPDGSILFGGPSGIRVVDPISKEETVLSSEAGHAVVSASGHLVEVTGGSLSAASFDLASHERSSIRVPLLGGLASTPGFRGFVLSDNGTLLAVYGQSFLGGGYALETSLQILDRRTGVLDSLDLPPAGRFMPQFSPDGSRLAYQESDMSVEGGTIFSIPSSGGVPRQLTFGGVNLSPRWAASGDSLVFASSRPDSDGFDLYVAYDSDPGTVRPLLPRPLDQYPLQWLDDGRVIFSDGNGTGDPLWILTPGEEPARYAPDEPLLEGSEGLGGQSSPGGRVSPDKSLMALVSVRLGLPSWLFLRGFPDPTGQVRVRRSGTNPRWTANGDTLLFWTRGGEGGDSLLAVPVDRTSGVSVGEPKVVYVTEFRGWDLHPDGDLVAISDAAAPGGLRVELILNWFELLKARLEGN